MEKALTRNYVRRIVDSAIWPGKRHCFSNEEIKSFKSVLTYDTSYLFTFGVPSEEVPHVGVFDSKRYGRKIPFFSLQEEMFLGMVEHSTCVKDVVEKPAEIVYDHQFTRVFVPDFLFRMKGGMAIMVMLMPYDHFSCQDTQRKWYALEQYCADMGFGCCLFDVEKGISLRWIMYNMYKMSNEPECGLETELMRELRKSGTRWICGGEIMRLLDRHGSNLCHLQMIVFKNGLLYVPKSTTHSISMLRGRSDDMFDTKLITTSYLFHEYERV